MLRTLIITHSTQKKRAVMCVYVNRKKIGFNYLRLL